MVFPGFHVVLLIVTILLNFYGSPLKSRQSMESGPFIIAHRGASGSAPENTIAAFRKALDIGVDMIELDIHLSKDSILIVCRDVSVNRTTNGAGEIRNLTLRELKQLDAGSWYGKEFTGERLPTLEEVMQLVNGQSRLLIEIKGKSNVYQGLEEILVELLKRYDAKSWCIVQSFHTPFLTRLNELDPGIAPYKLIVADVPLLPMYVDDGLKFGSITALDFCKAINPMGTMVSEQFINKVHARGQMVFVWTINEVKKAEKLIEMGADGIITNYPERMKDLVGGR